MTILKSKYKNPLPEFVTHGAIEAGSYLYILLINMEGKALIRRVKTDNSEILFTLKEDSESIADFWAGRVGKAYVYLYEVMGG